MSTSTYPRPYRAWINQPSTLQAHYHLHGQRVIAHQQGAVTCIYFLDGVIESQLIDPTALAKGWPND
jgi:hypothetical protein